MEQLDLFAEIRETKKIKSLRKRPEKLFMSKSSLQEWKNRIYEHQERMRQTPDCLQFSLFSLEQNSPDWEEINPFSLPLEPSLFYEKPESGDESCFYFVMDSTMPLLLYVGETKKSPKSRWKNHDCQEYIFNYIELHRRYNLPVSIGISFSWGAPLERRKRLELESELIQKWRSPFNKESWRYWGQPFGKN